MSTREVNASRGAGTYVGHHASAVAMLGKVPGAAERYWHSYRP